LSCSFVAPKDSICIIVYIFRLWTSFSAVSECSSLWEYSNVTLPTSCFQCGSHCLLFLTRCVLFTFFRWLPSYSSRRSRSSTSLYHMVAFSLLKQQLEVFYSHLVHPDHSQIVASSHEFCMVNIGICRSFTPVPCYLHWL
jgi:hypothetical protein